MAFITPGQRGLRQGRGAALPDARDDPRLLHGRRHGAGACLPLPHRRRRAEDQDGVARGDASASCRAGAGRSACRRSSARPTRSTSCSPGRGVDGAPREEARPRRRRHAAPPFRQRRARAPRQAAAAARAGVAAAVTDWPVVRSLVASPCRARGGRARCAATTTRRPTRSSTCGGTSAATCATSRRASGVDGEPVRPSDDAQPHPHLQAAGPPEGAREMRRRRADPPPARDRRRRHGRRHRGLGGAARASPSRCRISPPSASRPRSSAPRRSTRSACKQPHLVQARDGPPHPRRDRRRRGAAPTS